MRRSFTGLPALVVCTSVLYAALAETPHDGQPSSDSHAADGAIVIGQPGASNAEGRYRIATHSTSSGSLAVVVVDTRTGQIWVRMSRDKEWEDWGSPLRRK